MKPPIGLKPKKIHDLERRVAIMIAMKRYVENDKKIPREWIIEFDELNNQYEK